jgi:hypothetical protein
MELVRLAGNNLGKPECPARELRLHSLSSSDLTNFGFFSLFGGIGV